MIPKIIHFVWIGGPMPRWAVRNVQEFRDLNPGHEIRIHDEASLLPELEAAYASATYDAARADLIRYSALRVSGGWYFDVDFWPLRPVEDAERAQGLDGSRVFMPRIQSNKNPAMEYANGVLACGVGCAGMRTIVRLASVKTAQSRTTFGPQLMAEAIRGNQSQFAIGESAWWFPVNIEEASEAYAHLLSGDEGNLSMRRGTGGHRPFAVHLWATCTAEAMEEAMNRPTIPCRPLAIVAETSRETHPLTAFSRGLEACGFDVVRSGDAKSIGGQWSRPALIVCWNGRKDKGLPNLAARFEIPCLYLEHGFFDRQNFTQADHGGILHWSSWSKCTAFPAPTNGAGRLAEFAPERKPIRAREGYALVIGQIDNDTQMDDSEIRGGVQLQKFVHRNLPPHVAACFRPHPAAKYHPHPMHETLPLMDTCCERADYLKTKHGGGLAEALRGAAFVVTINSNACVEALCAGVPCLAFGPHIGIEAGAIRRTSLATLSRDLSDMACGWTPPQSSVDNYLEWLAARQWSNEELERGDVAGMLVRAAGVECGT